MEATIKQVGEKCLIKSANSLYRCKDLAEAIKTANIKGYIITNKNELPEYFVKQLKY